MRKFTFVVCMLMMLSCFCVSTLAVENTDTMHWDDEVHTNFGGGYPRMAQRDDGTLLLTTDAGYLYFSTDKGKTFKGQSPRAIDSAATTATVTKGGKTYSFSGLTRANLQPFVVSDKTVFLGYRCHTNTSSEEYKSSGHFYTSIRVLKSYDGGKTFLLPAKDDAYVDDVAAKLKKIADEGKTA